MSLQVWNNLTCNKETSHKTGTCSHGNPLSQLLDKINLVFVVFQNIEKYHDHVV